MKNGRILKRAVSRSNTLAVFPIVLKSLLAISFLCLMAVALVSTLNFVADTQSNHDAVAVSSSSNRYFYLGGMAVGLSVKSNGVIVSDLIEVETAFGSVTPNSGLQAGDIIIEINGEKVKTSDDVNNFLKHYNENSKQMEIKVLRGQKEKKLVAYPVIEKYTEYYKLGISLKNYAEGVGTVTYIKPSGEFASLGHPIQSTDGSIIIPCSGGNAFNCRIVGYNKGKKGNPGELRGVFTGTTNPMGDLSDNNRFGVYGRFGILPSSELVPIASRNEVKRGKAQIITTIKDVPERFDIEIIKTVNQSTPNERGIVFKVTDKRLLAATGGIVQGMSGSPIVQNGKLVGAVTHVFVNDPSRGYGVYMDWMYA